MLWDHLYEGPWSPQDVLEKQDGFVILGFKDVDNSTLRRQVVLLAIDSKGNVQWEQHYGGAGMEYGMAMLETEDGYLICGQTSSFPSPIMSERGYLLHVDRWGELLWERALPSPASYARGVERSPDGGFFIAGFALVAKNGTNEGGTCLVKVDASGEHLWSAVVGGPFSGAFGT